MAKYFTVFLFAVLVLSACEKDNEDNVPKPHPVMQYKDLHNAEVKIGQPQRLDLDDDGITDFNFGVLLLGDPILQRDRLQFYAFSKPERNLLNNENDESPVLGRLDIISQNIPGYKWFDISAIVLAEKIMETNNSFWSGLWKTASHKFLPVQVKRNNKLYNGWIEISMDTNGEKLILHRSGLSLLQDADVKAGY